MLLQARLLRYQLQTFIYLSKFNIMHEAHQTNNFHTYIISVVNNDDFAFILSLLMHIAIRSKHVNKNVSYYPVLC